MVLASDDPKWASRFQVIRIEIYVGNLHFPVRKRGFLGIILPVKIASVLTSERPILA
jgi:hypothetical protein